jgi:uncharacterized protein (TIGR00252 family)
MIQQDDIYPGYSFSSHVGYGTTAHIQAIDKLGVTPLHRLSFAPLKKYARYETIIAVRTVAAQNKTTKQIGDSAEIIGAQYLQDKGHIIIDRNWKTKFCEIDIVSRYKDVMYFTEVKYRKDTQQGGGFAAITAKKRRQMTFAAEYYALKHDLLGTDMRLCALAVTGNDASISELIEID